jgi:hypothetical protein
MSITEQSRELMAKERQKADQSQDNMLERAEEILQEGTEGALKEEARESLTAQRQHEAQTQDNMLERSTEEIS